jgi:hypothetical protein
MLNKVLEEVKRDYKFAKDEHTSKLNKILHNSSKEIISEADLYQNVKTQINKYSQTALAKKLEIILSEQQGTTDEHKKLKKLQLYLNKPTETLDEKFDAVLEQLDGPPSEEAINAVTKNTASPGLISYLLKETGLKEITIKQLKKHYKNYEFKKRPELKDKSASVYISQYKKALAELKQKSFTPSKDTKEYILKIVDLKEEYLQKVTKLDEIVDEQINNLPIEALKLAITLSIEDMENGEQKFSKKLFEADDIYNVLLTNSIETKIEEYTPNICNQPELLNKLDIELHKYNPPSNNASYLVGLSQVPESAHQRVANIIEKQNDIDSPINFEEYVQEYLTNAMNLVSKQYNFSITPTEIEILRRTLTSCGLISTAGNGNTKYCIKTIITKGLKNLNKGTPGRKSGLQKTINSFLRNKLQK